MIKLLKPMNRDGVIYDAGSELSLAPDTEAELIKNKLAVTVDSVPEKDATKKAAVKKDKKTQKKQEGGAFAKTPPDDGKPPENGKGQTFKDIVDADNGIVINEDELAEEHVINGKPVLICVDSERLARRMQGDLAGLTSCDLLFFCEVSDLDFEPKPSSVLKYDDKYAVIVNVGLNSGLYEIILQFNQGG